MTLSLNNQSDDKTVAALLELLDSTLKRDEEDKPVGIGSKPAGKKGAEDDSVVSFFGEMFNSAQSKAASAKEEVSALMAEEARRSAVEVAAAREMVGLKRSLAEGGGEIGRKPLPEGTTLRPVARPSMTTLRDVTGTDEGKLDNEQPLRDLAGAVANEQIPSKELEPTAKDETDEVVNSLVARLSAGKDTKEAAPVTAEARGAGLMSPTEEVGKVRGVPSNIDFDFIGEQEGNKSSIYVPKNNKGVVFDSSGPTIGTGVDIGQRSVAGLEGLPEPLVQKLAPYTGKKGQAALDYVRENPLSLSDKEIATINSWAKKQETDSLIKLWNRDSDIAWDDLTRQQATTVASVMYQYGSKRVRTPAFWKAATSGDWAEVEKELRNFGDKYTPRRLREADYLSGAD